MKEESDIVRDTLRVRYFVQCSLVCLSFLAVTWEGEALHAKESPKAMTKGKQKPNTIVKKKSNPWGQKAPPVPRYKTLIVKRKPSKKKPKARALSTIVPMPRSYPLVLESVQQKKLSKRLHTTLARKKSLRLLVVTDKPIYNPGGIIWCKAYALWHKKNQLLTGQRTGLVFELISPRGRVITRKWVRIVQGSGHNGFRLRKDVVGGEYTVRVRTFFSELYAEKKVVVQRFQAPRIKKKIDFLRKGYGAGDDVEATITLERAVGGPLHNHLFEVRVMLAGKLYKSWKTETGESGKALIGFPLPKDLSTDDGLMVILVRDAGVTETITRPLPLARRNVLVKFFPEGGVSAMGLSSRVYLAARRNIDLKPIDVEGHILDKSGNIVSKVRTFHDGMGRFVYTPQAGQSYTFKITKPKGIPGTFALPAAKALGISMQTIETFQKTTSTIPVKLSSVSKRDIFLVAFQHQTLMYVGSHSLQKGTQTLHIRPHAQWRGVMRVVVFDDAMKPLLERQVFRNRGAGMRLKIEAVRQGKRRFVGRRVFRPFDTPLIKITAQKPDGTPLANANLTASVVDDTVLNYADDHEPNLLAQRFLTSQLVGKIHKPNFYFSKKQQPKKRARALDLVMGVHGWIDISSVHQAPKKILSQRDPRKLRPTLLKWKPKTPRRLFSKRKVKRRPKPLKPVRKSTKQIKDQELPKQKAKREQAGGKKLLSQRTLRASKQDADGETLGKKRPGKVKKNRYNFSSRRISGILSAPRSPPRYSFKAKKKSVYRIRAKSLNRIQGTRAGGRARVDSPPSEERSARARHNHWMVRRVRRWRRRKKNQGSFAYRDLRGFRKGIRRYKKIRKKAIARAWQSFWSRQPYHRYGNILYWNRRIRRVVKQIDVYKRVIAFSTKLKKTRPGSPEAQALYRSKEATAFVYQYLYYDRSLYQLRRRRLSRKDPRFHAALERFHRNKNLQYLHRLRNYLTYRRRYVRQLQKNMLRVKRQAGGMVAWVPRLITNANGVASFRVRLVGDVTSYRVRVAGVGGGMLGADDILIESRKPFFAVAKIPQEVSRGDAIVVPLTVRNDLAKTLKVDIDAYSTSTVFKLVEDPAPSTVVLGAHEARTFFYPFRVVGKRGRGWIKFAAQAGHVTTHVSESVSVMPRGFPRQIGDAGKLTAKGRLFSFALPQDLQKSRPLAEIQVYPNPIGELLSGSESILRKPYGCFEQTSSSNFPNTMVMQYLSSQKHTAPTLRSRALHYLDKGYRRLVGFETSSGGFSLFGRPPGNVPMTAYGIWQFSEMGRVYPVDKSMIKRQIRWVKAKMNAQGMFPYNRYNRRSKRILVNTAYVAFALSQAGHKDLEKTLKAMNNDDNLEKDPYPLALATLTMQKIWGADDKRAKKRLAQLLALQQLNGSFRGRVASATYSRGLNLYIETTSLAILSMIRAHTPIARIFRSVEWLYRQRRGYGRFGTTQATVLALKALLAFQKYQKFQPAPGTLEMAVNGKLLKKVSYTKQRTQPIRVSVPFNVLRPGKNTLRLSLAARNEIPFLFRADYTAYKPASVKQSPLAFRVEMKKRRVRMGDTVRLVATLQNTSEKELPMTMARIRFPGAMAFQTWQLKALKQKGIVDAYETRPREVTFYFLKLKPKAHITLPLDLIARVTGNYNSMASSAYLYYEDDVKLWTEPLWISVRP